jgi:hypothetical protein
MATEHRVCIQYYDEHGKGAGATVEFATEAELPDLRLRVEKAGGVVQSVDGKPMTRRRKK